MDKSWMDPFVGKCSRKYILGCQQFIEFAWNNRNVELGDEMYCPCVRCINIMRWPKNVVEHHIRNRGILRSYVRWTKHGESGEVNTSHESNEGDDMHRMLQDALGFQNIVASSSIKTQVTKISASEMSEIDGVEVDADIVDEDMVDVVECDEDFISDSDCEEDIIDFSDEDEDDIDFSDEY
ncbi:hypothetical protein IFM89_029973 [Coptis chinensis]|uniref:Transposase-associated domain-containing protein n=1 Tax=Coptis chinensis TaxID=261450 RepID=A0A835IHG2_9MAGN|nr:hypothetical protein IFM89_029973 [Coptis chinensis]